MERKENNECQRLPVENKQTISYLIIRYNAARQQLYIVESRDETYGQVIRANGTYFENNNNIIHIIKMIRLLKCSVSGALVDVAIEK